MYYQLTDRFQVSADVEKTWQFFSTAQNLSRITPPWLGFKVRTAEPITIELDTVLEYTVKALGIPVHWRTKIIELSPPRQFIDLQIKGPYSLWHHQHSFEPVAGGGGVVCSDRVIYRIPGGPIGRLLHALVIRGQLLEIFRFRRKAIAQHLGSLRAVQEDVQIRAL